MQQLITIEHDGSFPAIMTFDKKSYVLMDWKGKLKIRGQSLKGRNLEPYLRQFLKDCIVRLFDSSDVSDIYFDYYSRIQLCMLSPEEIAKTANLNESLEAYKNSVANNPNKNRAAPYELAIADTRHYEKGDVIKYYIVEPPMETVMVRNKEVTRPKKLRAFESAKHIKNYNYDYDIQHYTERLAETTKRLLSVLGEDLYRQNFPDIKLTKKDLLKLKNTEATEDEE